MITIKAPTVLYLQIADRCNDRCPGCSLHSSEKKEKTLALEDWKFFLKRVSPDLHEVRIMGGEPSLSEDFFPLLDFLEERKVIFSLYTNGRWPSPEPMMKRLRYYSCLSQLVVTCAGHNAALHEWYTQVPGSFEEMKENVLQASLRGFRINLQCQIHKKNYQSLGDMHFFARSLGVQIMQLSRHHCLAASPPLDEERVLSREDWSRIREESRKLSIQGLPVRFAYCFPRCFNDAQTAGCYAGLSIMALDPWGYVHPCPHDPLSWGALPHNDLSSLWKSRGSKEWRKRTLPAPCNGCRIIDQCHGRCRRMDQGDPLVCGPDSTVTGSAQAVQQLNASLKPIGNFLVRKEDFGFSLIKGHVLIPASPEFSKIKDLLDGKHTLSEIYALTGDSMLSFIYSLQERNFITLV
jgi:radical SAM protein with 4Fe4S-binding SPASM domain